MPAVTRLGDTCTGHDDCPPVALTSASGDVLINSCKVHPSHSGVIASGSGSVTINGRPAARVGDPVSCGGSVAQGSGNVTIGG